MTARIWAAVAWACLPAAGCGYRWTTDAPGGVSTIHVEVFGNDTTRHGWEEQLTASVAEELEARLSVRLAPRASADAVLSGRVTDIRDRVLVGRADESLAESSVMVTVFVELVSRDGRVLRAFTATERGEFVPARGESRSGATLNTIRDLAEEIVLGLGVGSTPGPS